MTDDDVMVTFIPPGDIAGMWHLVEGALALAINTNKGEETLQDVKLRLQEGHSGLFVQHAGPVISAAGVVALVHYPRYTVAFIEYLAGTTTRRGWQLLQSACNRFGATKIQAFCGPAQARLFRRYGLTEAYSVMRMDL